MPTVVIQPSPIYTKPCAVAVPSIVLEPPPNKPCIVLEPAGNGVEQSPLLNAGLLASILNGGVQNKPATGGAQNPLLGIGVQTSLLGAGSQNPSDTTGAQKPLLGVGVQSSLLGAGAQNPSDTTGAQKPLLGVDVQSSLLGTGSQTSGTTGAQTPLLGAEVQTPLLGAEVQVISEPIASLLGDRIQGLLNTIDTTIDNSLNKPIAVNTFRSPVVYKIVQPPRFPVSIY
ncbi:hypothetical protein O3G_MSEX009783 [Manduca sexta]|nr:hypothetical protein O3G_MSEX009783 [Manduca sexta]